jgi:hypothetical protein
LGSSPVVEFEGCGIYFLDKLSNGVWRLEVYPDAVIVQDPFAQHLNYKTVCSRLIAREWPMTLRLPDLGDAFAVSGLNAGNSIAAKARHGSFKAKPGVYLLAKGRTPDAHALPQRIGGIGLREFVCPEPPDLPTQILPRVREVYSTDQPLTIGADVIDIAPPKSVVLHLRAEGDGLFRSYKLAPKRGYRWEASVPSKAFPTGSIEFYFVADTVKGQVHYPAETEKPLNARLVSPMAPLPLFDAETDVPLLVFTRVGDGVRHGIFQHRKAAGPDPASLRLFFPLSYDRALDDYTASLTVKDRMHDRRPQVQEAKGVRVQARSAEEGQEIYLTLVEADGTSWSRRLTLSTNWQEQVVAVGDFTLGRGVKLPLGFPGRWNYWLTPSEGRGGPNDQPHLEEVERFQVSLRPGGRLVRTATDTWADIASAKLIFQ